jgi:hypothetical protein
MVQEISRGVPEMGRVQDSRETDVERGWTLHTHWLPDVTVASNRSASPDVDSLSLDFDAGGGASWPVLSASTCTELAK